MHAGLITEIIDIPPADCSFFSLPSLYRVKSDPNVDKSDYLNIHEPLSDLSNEIKSIIKDLLDC